MLFWFPSSRGFNGYLKVDLNGMDYALANEHFDRLETALILYLASCGNLADFELKGKIGFMRYGQYQWASYGKLPIHDRNWNFDRLEEFRNTPSVPIHRLGSLCGTIEAQVPHDVLGQHQRFKISRGDKPIFEGDWFLVTPAIDKAMTEKHGEAWRYLFSMRKGDEEETWLRKNYYRPGRIPLTEKELRAAGPCVAQADLPRNHQRPASPPQVQDSLQGQLEAVFHRIESDTADDEADFKQVLAGLFDRMESGDNEGEKPRPRKNRVAVPAAEVQEPRPQCQSAKVNLDFSDLMDEPDSFKRQKEALSRYSRYLKRVPILDEGMQLLRDQHLFSGSWEDNLAGRRARVRDILKFISRTFDASKCANGHVNVGKYDAWAAKKFPNGLVGGKSRYMDEDGNVIEVPKIMHVGTKFIAVFMAVTEFAILIDKNKDDTFPHNRADELWDALYAKGLIPVKFNARKWAVCRDEIERHEIIAIPDRNYGQGRAMKWATGLYFPFLGNWKTKKQPSLMGPVDLATFLEGKREEREEKHNTLLQSQSVEDAVLVSLKRSRPPP